MNAFNNEMNYIESPDLDLGYLTTKTAKLIWNYILESEEEGHYETIQEYPNGGKDVEWIVDVPEVGHWETKYEDGTLVDMEHYDGDEQPDESWDHTVEYTTKWDYYLYTLYTPEELEQITKEKAEQARLDNIAELKQKLFDTDYIITKIAEYQVSGVEMPEDDAQRYAEIMKQREEWRKQINELEAQAPQESETQDS